MNWKSILEKSLICLLLLFLLCIGWVFARFVLLLMAGQRFYLRFADAAACTLAVFIVLWVFAFVRAKVTNLLFVTCLIPVYRRFRYMNITGMFATAWQP